MVSAENYLTNKNVEILKQLKTNTVSVSAYAYNFTPCPMYSSVHSTRILLGNFSRFSFAKPIVNGEYTLPVSVLICAKNEAENLEKNLPYILEQEYQNFQIVLINDASIDNTLKVMESFAHRDSRIKIVDVRNNEAFWGKKYALTLGIKSAKNDLLIFTDADCRPAGKHWLKQMVGSFSNTQTIVLGFGGYQTIKHSLLNQLIRFETVLTAIQYFSYAISGMPYMGVGRNMAYHRDEFLEFEGL